MIKHLSIVSIFISLSLCISSYIFNSYYSDKLLHNLEEKRFYDSYSLKYNEIKNQPTDIVNYIDKHIIKNEIYKDIPLHTYKENDIFYLELVSSNKDILSDILGDIFNSQRLNAYSFEIKQDSLKVGFGI